MLMASMRCGHFVVPAEAPSKYPDLERRVLELVNAHRDSLGLGPLRWSDVIAGQCRLHCERMAMADRYYGHEGFEERFAQIRRMLGVAAASENVACNTGFVDPAAAAFEGWLASAPHRGSIEGRFSTTGIGIDRSITGRYFFAEIFVQ